METCEVNNAKHYSIGSQQDCMVTLLERITRLGAKKYMATYLFLFLYLSWAMRTHSEVNLKLLCRGQAGQCSAGTVRHCGTG